MGKGEDVPYENVVLPVFDQPEPELPRERSKKEQDDDVNKIQYQRYKPQKRAQCEECVLEHIAGERKGINDASYIRTHGTGKLYLCFQHATAHRDRDQLNGDGKQ